MSTSAQAGAPAAADQSTFEIPPATKRCVMAFILVGFAHLAVGIVMGFLQGMSYMGIDLFPFVGIFDNYYQALSIHGTFNVLMFTTFFILGFLTLVTVKTLQRPLWSTGLLRVNFWLTLVGALLTDWALLTGRGTVLFTSYAPLQAHPAYYIGLALVVVGTLVLLLNLVVTYIHWRRDNPGQRTPLMAFAALTTLIMWGLATFGVVVQFVGMLIPWSLGLLEGVDPLLSRTLFWQSGHPIVYFWLLPAYISWYFMLPAQNGGKLFSESLARLAFLLFIPLSLPVGFHHQFVDPGVSEGYKALHAFITFGVFMPSMITAFTVLASLETGARSRGGQGRLGWIRRLNWSNPAVAAQLLGMIIFALGGISGLVNASFNLNLVVHNTLFVPGHFHLTVGTAVALTFMGTAYWLVPHLTGRKLWGGRLAIAQVWLWFVGMLLMSRGMTWAGLQGAPRRTFMAGATYKLPEWTSSFQLLGVGGAILTVSGVLFFVILAATLLNKARVEASEVEFPIATPLYQENVPGLLDRFAPWVVVAVLLVVMGYGPMYWQMLNDLQMTSPGFRSF
ncbi:MAG TPA: cbb3-type cytochrome c oxidase subunit I [Sphingobacteriaceae bacterium]|nr:cbb3-type cytochrome c oxidase subunit I [Sphingobacteriaceae bacterium]